MMDPEQSTDIIFISPPGGLEKNFKNQLGAAYIQAFLKKNKISSVQHVSNRPMTLDSIANELLKKKPKIVGFTCNDSNYFFTKLISETIKKKQPSTFIIAGGPSATFSDELILRNTPSIDLCVRGEGESTTYEIFNRLNGNMDLKGINGISYREEGKVVRTPSRELICDRARKGAELDILPSPYLTDTLTDPVDISGILTARGCIYRCTYCNFSSISRHTIRYHSVGRVISELKKIEEILNNSKARRIKNKTIAIFDDTFSLNPERAKEICRRIIDEGINLRLWCETRADKVDKELLELMKASGCDVINFGLESAVPRILKEIKKVRIYAKEDNNGLKPEKEFVRKAKQNVKLAKKVGIRPTISIIIGLPNETLEDVQKTLNFVKKLNVDYYFHNNLHIFTGTELFRTHKKYGLKIKPFPSILPNETIPAINLQKIKPEKNSSVFLDSVEAIVDLHNLLAIGNETSKPDKKIFCEYILFNGLTQFSPNVINWLRNIKFALTKLIFILPDNKFEEKKRNIINSMISAKIPTEKYLFLVPQNESDFKSGNFEFFFQKKYYLADSIVPTIQFIPLSKAELKCRENLGNKFLTLNNFEDLNRFKEILENKKITKLSSCFVNECMWLDSKCPATCLTRAIIEKDGTISPCLNGGKIGRVGDGFGKLKRNIVKRWEKEKKKRGCSKCPVEKSCSKCLFPHPLSPKEYCRIRKMNPHTGNAIKSLHILNQTELFANSPVSVLK